MYLIDSSTPNKTHRDEWLQFCKRPGKKLYTSIPNDHVEDPPFSAFVAPQAFSARGFVHAGNAWRDLWFKLAAPHGVVSRG